MNPRPRRFRPLARAAWKNETHAGLREALRAARAEKRKPDEGDRPPPGVFRGPKHKLIAGQLSLDDDDQAA